MELKEPVQLHEPLVRDLQKLAAKAHKTYVLTLQTRYYALSHDLYDLADNLTRLAGREDDDLPF